MKNKFISAIILTGSIVACSPVPNTSVFETLPTKNLAKVLEKEPDFETIYTQITEGVKSFNEIEKAKFNDITWSKIYTMYKFSSDTLKTNPLFEQWRQEWDDKFGKYNEQVDSVITYWKDYKEKNSLDRFVRVEFAEIDKDYYSYSYDVKEVNLGFRLIPVNGRIEQVKFNYRFSAKINSYYGERRNCISTTPFSSPVVRYWEVNYSDEQTLKNLNTESFKRDYDIKVEVTDVRKDGINYSINDLNIPSSVSSYLDDETGILADYYRNEIIEDLLCPEYKRSYEYTLDKWDELMAEKFPRQQAFMKLIEDKEMDE